MRERGIEGQAGNNDRGPSQIDNDDPTALVVPATATKVVRTEAMMLGLPLRRGEAHGEAHGEAVCEDDEGRPPATEGPSP